MPDQLQLKDMGLTIDVARTNGVTRITCEWV